MKKVFTEDATVPTTEGGTLGAIQLLVLGEGEPVRVPLTEARAYTIGRSLEADIYVNDPSLSRLHAVLRIEPEGAFSLEDLDSSNGTSLRGARLSPKQRAPLALGETAELGRTTLLLQRAGAPLVRLGTREPADVVIADPAMRQLYALVDRIAGSDIGVLILGETGVGKEILAKAVHDRSRRKDSPFLALNCGAFSDELLESELLGHERGAFTGAVKHKPGLFEIAEGGTVFLDEVGEMSLATQVKLLRVLEERRFRRLGGIESLPLEARVIAATNRDLEAAVRQGKFRQDLYYRLNGFTMVVPPLRERASEIGPLTEAFATAMARREGRPDAPRIGPRAHAALMAYAWPGNVRELKNVVERAVVLAGEGPVELEHLPMERMQPTPSPAAPTVSIPKLARPGAELKAKVGEAERDAILAALERCGGNQTRAAELLGISRKSLLRRLDQYDVPRPKKGRPDSDPE